MVNFGLRFFLICLNEIKFFVRLRIEGEKNFSVFRFELVVGLRKEILIRFFFDDFVYILVLMFCVVFELYSLMIGIGYLSNWCY